MSDQSGDLSGSLPQANVGENSPFMSGPAGPTSSFTVDTPATTTFGAPTAPATSPGMGGGGGGAVSAPSFSAPPSSPAGFGGGGSAMSTVAAQNPPSGFDALFPQSSAELTGTAAPAAIATAQNALNATETPAGGVGGASGRGGGGNSVLNAIRDPSFDSIVSAIGNNLGPLVGAGVLGFEAANKPGGQQLPAAAQPGPTATALVQQAGTLQTAGQALSQPIMTGVLPPGAQASVDQLTQQQEAQIRQQFGQMGLSGSTMEATAIAQAQQGAQARAFQIAQNMAQLGLSDMQASTAIFRDLLNSGLQSDQQFQQALAQFANSLAGGGGTTLKLSA